MLHPELKRIELGDDSHHVHVKTHIHVRLKNIQVIYLSQ
jgi:hypothetical protein